MDSRIYREKQHFWVIEMAFTKRNDWHTVALNAKQWETLRSWLVTNRKLIDQINFFQLENTIKSCRTRNKLPRDLDEAGWTNLIGVPKLDQPAILEGLKLAGFEVNEI